MPCCACTTGRGLRGDRVETSISGCIAAWHINRLCSLAIGQTRCSLYANRCIQAEIYSHPSSFLILPFTFTSAPAGSSGQQGDRARRSAPVRRPIATLHLACFLTACTGHPSISHAPPWVAPTPEPLPSRSLPCCNSVVQMLDKGVSGPITRHLPLHLSPSNGCPGALGTPLPPLLPPKAQSRRHHSAWWKALEPAQGLGSLKEPLAGSGSISKAQGH